MDPVDPYAVDQKLQAEFAPEKFNEYLRVFRQLDVNKNGSIEKDEIIKGNLYNNL